MAAENDLRETVARLLPGGPSPAERRTLDFDRQGANGSDGGFDLIWAARAFTELREDWAERLVDLHRLLAADGLLIVALLPPETYEQLAGQPWSEERVGMSVLEAAAEKPLVVLSDWWLRAHWGRAFEVVATEEIDGRVWVGLKRREVSFDAEELVRPADDPRELSAARANVADLISTRARAEAKRRYELDAQKEALSRELVRKTYQLARAERDTERALSVFTNSLSWKVTRPLRGAKTLLARRRGG
jgi:SAM-dependent methyltransferase